jgi:hypothetical protein
MAFQTLVKSVGDASYQGQVFLPPSTVASCCRVICLLMLMFEGFVDVVNPPTSPYRSSENVDLG